jgi:uncharacterized membrane protein
MHLSPVLLVHICGAVISLIAGALSMVLRKGSSRHAIAGNIFVGSMVIMTTTGAYIAAMNPSRGSFVVALLTLYLVITSWVTGRRRTGRPGAFDIVALTFAAIVGAQGIAWGIEVARGTTRVPDGIPAGVYYFFSTVALLCAASDVRMYVRGGVFGAKRIVRHLWRMCFALLITAMSFYPGQAKLFPAALRATNILYVPILLLFAAMLFWIVRVKFSSAFRRRLPDAGPSSDTAKLVPAPSNL